MRQRGPTTQTTNRLNGKITQQDSVAQPHKQLTDLTVR